VSDAKPQWATPNQRPPRKRSRTARAWVRMLGVALWKVRWPLLVLVVTLLGGTLLFWLNGTYDNPLRSLLYVLNLVTLQAGPDDLPRPVLLQIISGVILIAGLIALAGGAASVIQLLGDPKERQLALASTFSDHVVVCGIGRVGYRVINELLAFGESVVGVNSSENEEWLPTLQKAGVPVIIGDARRKQTLIDAGVERASSIVACTSDELTNLDMSLDARELNPNIKVVLRMFDAKLAQNVSKGFNIQTVFSVSALAAPAFAAAATRAKVDYSFKLEGQVLNVSTITFQATSPFIGKTLGHIEDEVNCSVVGTWANDGMQMNPHRDHTVQPGERYYVVGSLIALRTLNNGQ
jgi:Trk K+ transport system NAD-binding subunit